jgi:uncharacterized protein
MQIKVSQLIGEPIGSERDYKIHDNIDIMDNGDSIAIQGNVKLTRTDKSILVQGKFDTSVELTCARCLEIFNYPFELRFKEEYFSLSDLGSDRFSSKSDEVDLFSIDDDQVIDLTEAIRQYALMEIPMKPLCRQDCSGLLTSI